jgi:PiT family inorganic phosphate transporter
MSLFLLSSGLFLGWSLGANDAANVFGTAVGTRMVRFRTAAIICSGFVVLGAVFGGSGTSHTIQMLGAVTTLGGCFTIALCAALTVLWMTRAGLPVSTSQAVVGSILGWNLFTATETDTGTLTNVCTSWVISPLLAALIAGTLLLVTRAIIPRLKIHLLRVDSYTRAALVIAGALGSYSLGANNIANVMGVFVPTSPFSAHELLLGISISPDQQLFLLGGIAIAVGAYTYSRRVIYTVGNEIMKLSPIAAFVVVLSHGIVLFIFSSQHLRGWLLDQGLPALPLVPISSSHAVIGAIVGIGLVKGIRGIRLKVLGGVAAAWIVTPVVAGTLTFVALFFVQNVFELPVHTSTTASSTVSTPEGRELGAETYLGLRVHESVAFPELVRQSRIDGLPAYDLLPTTNFLPPTSNCSASLFTQSPFRTVSFQTRPAT